MVTRERLYTAADVWALAHTSEYEAQRLNLIKGELYAMSLAGGEHGEVVMELGFHIRFHTREHHLGRVTAAETGYLLATNPDTVLAPDVGFIALERAPDGLPKGHIPFAPDLAVEVVSPNDRPGRLMQKIEAYLQAGTRLVWVVYPEEKIAEVWRRGDGSALIKHTLGSAGVLDGEDVLPGFRLALRDIFTS